MSGKEWDDASDDELVERYLGGDRRAFEGLVLRHQDRIYRLCLRTLGSPSRAEEAAQEVFVKVYRHLDKFRGDSKFTTWLYRVALNHCRNVQAYRARRHEKRHDSLDAEIEGEDGSTRRKELADEGPSPEENLLTAQRLQIMTEELAQLDPIWKEILLLRDVEGLSYEEIGESLDLAPGTVKSRIHRARGELKERLSRRLKGEERVS